MAFPLSNTGAQHFADRTLGLTTVATSVGTESTDTIAVTCTLTDLGGNTIASADAWIAEVVGLEVAAYTLAETGAGAEVSATGSDALLFTFSAAGAAEITVTDVVGASGATVQLALRPADSLAVPTYVAVTFD